MNTLKQFEVIQHQAPVIDQELGGEAGRQGFKAVAATRCVGGQTGVALVVYDQLQRPRLNIGYDDLGRLACMQAQTAYRQGVRKRRSCNIVHDDPSTVAPSIPSRAAKYLL